MKINSKLNITLLFVFIFTFNIIAQENKETHYSSWNTLNVVKDLNSKWSVNTEIHLRRTNFLSKWEQVIVRPFVHYKLENNLYLAFGYSYIRNYHFSDYSLPINANENNIFQQLSLKNKFSKFSFDHRLRFEERFIDDIITTSNNDYNIDGMKHKNRFRYKFQLTIPLIKKEKSLNLLMYDEAFIDFDNGLRPENLDQNWMFFGLSLHANNHVSIKTGYHDIYLRRTDLSITNKIWETTLTYKI